MNFGDIPFDIQNVVISFLCIRDVVTLETACSNYSKDLISTFFWANVIEGLGILPKQVKSSGLNLRLVFKILILRIAKHNNMINIIDDVVAVSSVDRVEESPRNILKRSNCARDYKALGEGMNVSSELHQSILRSFMLRISACKCFRERPCYWSSASSPSPNRVEYISFSHICRDVGIIIGFSITPYKSFLQPLAPVYAPVQVQLQCIFDDDGENDIYYESKAFDVRNSFTDQYFLLEAPVVIIAQKTTIKLVLIGMQQRQTIAELNDYYVCLCNFLAYGFSVPLLHVGIDSNLEVKLSGDSFLDTYNEEKHELIEEKLIDVVDDLRGMTGRLINNYSPYNIRS